MFYSNERHALRQQFYTVYNKQLAKKALDPMELTIWQAIQDHPEYHYLFENQSKYLDKDFLVEAGEVNPFLHMSGHIGLQEQIVTNRPKGIQKIYQQLQQAVSAHDAEHLMMECMMETLWQAQRSGAAPDEQYYLKQLRKLLK